MKNSVTDLIDLARYPIADLDSEAAQALVAECQAALKESGACSLPGFGYLINQMLVRSLI